MPKSKGKCFNIVGRGLPDAEREDRVCHARADRISQRLALLRTTTRLHTRMGQATNYIINDSTKSRTGANLLDTKARGDLVPPRVDLKWEHAAALALSLAAEAWQVAF